MGFAEIIARRNKALDVEAAARKARDDKEAEAPEVEALLLDGENIVIHCSESSVDMPGLVICRKPSPEQVARFKQLMWKDSKDRGVVEAKSKAGEQMARHCLLYPPPERYAALVAKYGMIPEKVSKSLIEAAEAAADEVGKG